MKIIVIGANHAGTSFLREITSKTREHKIITYDKNSNISFLGCGISLWVSGEFEDPKELFYSSVEDLENLGIKVKLEHEVIRVDVNKKQLTIKNLNTKEEFFDSYDKLIYSAGTWPVIPPLLGIDLKNILFSKLFQHAQNIKKKVQNPFIKNVVVVGGGYIGLELVEAFNKANKNVILIDMEKRVVSRYFDKEFTKPLQDLIKKSGVKLVLGEKIEKFIGDIKGNVKEVITNKGKYTADLVIMSIGFKPQTQLISGQLDLDRCSKSLLVNEYMQTSNSDVYGLGDSVALMHNSIKKPIHVALATNAIKTGIIAAYHILGIDLPFPGIQGTNGINVFGCIYTSTGISSDYCIRNNIDFAEQFLKDKDRPEFMNNSEDIQIKIIYNPKTLRLLGAQIGSFGLHNHSEAIFVLSLAISKKMTLPEILLIDVYFLPHYNKPINYILQVILNALNKK